MEHRQSLASVQFPDLGFLAGLPLVEVDRQVADLTTQAQAFVSEVNRVRRAAIRSAVDGPGAVGRRRERVEAVAAELGISVTQVYQAVRAAEHDPKPLMEILARKGL